MMKSIILGVVIVIFVLGGILLLQNIKRQPSVKFTLHEGTEYINLKLSSEKFKIHVSRWGNIGTQYIPDSNSKDFIYGIIDLLKNHSPVEIAKNLTSIEYEKQYGVYLTDTAPNGAIGFFSYSPEKERKIYMEYYYCNNNIWRIVISDNYIRVTYIYKDAKEIIEGIEKALLQMKK